MPKKRNIFEGKINKSSNAFYHPDTFLRISKGSADALTVKEKTKKVWKKGLVQESINIGIQFKSAYIDYHAFRSSEKEPYLVEVEGNFTDEVPELNGGIESRFWKDANSFKIAHSTHNQRGK